MRNSNKQVKKLIIALSALLGISLFVFPLVVEAATANTTISSVISSVISVSTSGTVNDNVTPTGSGAQTINSDTVTVSTNDSAGYTLKLGLTSAQATLNDSGSDTIAASTGTQATPIVQVANSWGYAVQGVGGFNGSGYTSTSSAAISGTLKFAGVPATASPDTLKTTSATASNDTTTVWYAVAANSSQVAGTYTDSVTYTATAN